MVKSICHRPVAGVSFVTLTGSSVPESTGGGARTAAATTYLYFFLCICTIYFTSSCTASAVLRCTAAEEPNLRVCLLNTKT